MSFLADRFFMEAHRVTAQILYFMPLKEGQAPLQIESRLIGQRPQQIHHTNVLQTFAHQFDDVSDLEDPALVKVFRDVVVAKGGLINIHDRKSRLSIMAEGDGPTLPVIIPRPSEELNPGLKDEVKTFKTLIPFPQVREFLQFWQENIEGPIHQVQLATMPLGQVGWRNVSMDKALN